MDNGLTRSQKRQQKQLASDVRAMLEHAPSRRILCHLLDMTGMFTTSFTGNSETFFREGKRSVGLYLMNLINSHDPNAFIRLLQEAENHRHELATKATEDASDED